MIRNSEVVAAVTSYWNGTSVSFLMMKNHWSVHRSQCISVLLNNTELYFSAAM